MKSNSAAIVFPMLLATALAACVTRTSYVDLYGMPAPPGTAACPWCTRRHLPSLDIGSL